MGIYFEDIPLGIFLINGKRIEQIRRVSQILLLTDLLIYRAFMRLLAIKISDGGAQFARVHINK